jgi:hypothetical protein
MGLASSGVYSSRQFPWLSHGFWILGGIEASSQLMTFIVGLSHSAIPRVCQPS